MLTIKTMDEYPRILLELDFNSFFPTLLINTFLITIIISSNTLAFLW